jgi:hypothetical protein
MALFFLTLWGSMADGHAPLLGDPNFSCGEVKLERCNCYFSPVFEVVLSKDVKANEEILIDYNRYLTK